MRLVRSARLRSGSFLVQLRGVPEQGIEPELPAVLAVTERIRRIQRRSQGIRVAVLSQQTANERVGQRIGLASVGHQGQNTPKLGVRQWTGGG